MESSDSDEYFDAEEGLERDKEAASKRDGSAPSPSRAREGRERKAQGKKEGKAEETVTKNGGKLVLSQVQAQTGGCGEGNGGRVGESGKPMSPDRRASKGRGGAKKQTPTEEEKEKPSGGTEVAMAEQSPKRKAMGHSGTLHQQMHEREGFSMSLPSVFRRGGRRGKEKEGEEVPVPPPRRKRKKKPMMERQASLDDLDKPFSSPIPRSMTVASVDLRRESSASVESSERGSVGELRGKSPSGSSGKSEAKTPEGSQMKVPSMQPKAAETASPKVWKKSKSVSPEVEGDNVLPPSAKAPTRSRSHEEVAVTTEKELGAELGAKLSSESVPVVCKPEGRLRSRPADSPDSIHRSATPVVLIEPNISLELTEEMISVGESEVVTTATDAPLAKAWGAHGPVTIMYEDEDSMGEEYLDMEETDGGDGRVGVAGATGAEGYLGGGEGGESGRREQLLARASHSPTDDSKILEKTMIKNLDTGEAFPLSAAEEKIPRGWGWSPLSEHLIRRMELASGVSMDDDDTHGDSLTRRRPRIKRKLKHFFGKLKEGRHAQEGVVASDDELGPPGQEKDNQHSIKYKPSSHYKGPLEFEKVRLKQDLSGVHLGAVWTMEFSICGRLLATAGQDSVVRVWVMRTAYQFFHELQSKYQRLGVHSSGDSIAEKVSVTSTTSSRGSDPDDESKGPFLDQPLCSYYGHQADILDLSWSKNFFLLSSSMDKTVRLWHISRKECLCCFQHVDFVTAIAFHPRDDRYFLSGSLDGKIRLWNIPDKRVALWNEIEFVGSRLITAANFCNNGKLAVAGTYDGRCIFYDTEHLKYHTQIQVRSRHGKNKGRKISGVEPLPGEDMLLVTSNDSRVRLYNLKDHSLSCKYKGGLNTSSQIKATFSQDGQYMISGSEDNYIYIWKTHHDVSKLSSARRDRNEYYESFSAHSAPVTTAVFAPVPGITVDEGLKEVGHMVVAADYQGCIKVYVNSEQL